MKSNRYYNFVPGISHPYLQVSAAVNKATSRSLVLLDEFGKGTDSTSGISLLAATLRQWLAKGNDCPHVFASTHFHGIGEQNLLPTTTLLKYQVV